MSPAILMERADAALAAVEQVAIVMLTGSIALIIMLQVVLRHVFAAPLFWAEEVAVQLLVFVSVLGLSLLARRGDLVSVDMLSRLLPERARHALMALLGVVMLALIVFLGSQAWDWIGRPEVRVELSATLRIPRWYAYAVLPIGLSFMALHQGAAIVRHIAALWRPTGGRA